MVGEVNIVIIIKTTLKIIIDWFKLPVIPIIVYTDLYSLYKYLVKLSTIKKKYLMIDIMVLQYQKIPRYMLIVSLSTLDNIYLYIKYFKTLIDEILYISDILTDKAYNYIKYSLNMLYIYPNNPSK